MLKVWAKMIHSTKAILPLILFSCFLLLGACTGPETTPIPSASPTATSSPRSTPKPTALPTSAATPMATPTPAPTPTPTPLREGVQGASSSVEAIAVGPDGEVYVGGDFFAESVNAYGIASWNGRCWSAMVGAAGDPRWLPTSYGDSVHAIAVSGNHVYVAGAVRSWVAKWDKSTYTWSTVGDGTREAVPGLQIVRSLAVSPNGTLYVGGTFGACFPGTGCVDLPFVARRAGAQWSALPGLDGSGPGVPRALLFEGSLYVGGNLVFRGLAPPVAYAIARWNGTQWETLGPTQQFDRGVGLVGYSNALAAGRGGLYVGGLFDSIAAIGSNGYPSEVLLVTRNIALWSGSKWSALGSGVGGTVFAIAVAATGDVYVGGHFTEAGGVKASNIARWDGHSWHSLGSGVGGDVFAIAVTPTGDVYVGGHFTEAGGVKASNIARWDGLQWSPLLDQPVASSRAQPGAPVVEVSTGGHDFGPVAVSHPERNVAYFAVRNRNAELRIGQLSITERDAADFRIVEDGCSGQSIKVCGSCLVKVEFSPKNAGNKLSLLKIPTNDPERPVVGISLLGRGQGGIVFDWFFFEGVNEAQLKQRRSMLDGLIEGLEEATGLNLDIKDRQLVEVPGGDGGGSKYYRGYLKYLMGQTNSSILIQNRTDGSSQGDPETRILSMDFEYWRTAPPLYHIAIIFAHESWHIVTGLNDDQRLRDSTGTSDAKPGDHEFSVAQNIEPTDFENILRQDLGLNLRVTYAGPTPPLDSVAFLYESGGQYRVFQLTKQALKFELREWGLLQNLDRLDKPVARAVLTGYVGRESPLPVSDRVTAYRNVLVELRDLYFWSTGDFKGAFMEGRIVINIHPGLPATVSRVK